MCINNKIHSFFEIGHTADEMCNLLHFRQITEVTKNLKPNENIVFVHFTNSVDLFQVICLCSTLICLRNEHENAPNLWMSNVSIRKRSTNLVRRCRMCADSAISGIGSKPPACTYMCVLVFFFVRSFVRWCEMSDVTVVKCHWDWLKIQNTQQNRILATKMCVAAWFWVCMIYRHENFTAVFCLLFLLFNPDSLVQIECETQSAHRSHTRIEMERNLDTFDWFIIVLLLQ